MPVNIKIQTLFCQTFIKDTNAKNNLHSRNNHNIKRTKIMSYMSKRWQIRKNVVFERRSDGQTILCTRCEALTVVTNHNLREVELSATKDYQVMLKEPHLIRKVTY